MKEQNNIDAGRRLAAGLGEVRNKPAVCYFELQRGWISALKLLRGLPDCVSSNNRVQSVHEKRNYSIIHVRNFW